MIRHNSNDAGKLDPEFGRDGVATIIHHDYPSITISCVETGPDQKIYVAGTVSGGSVPASACVLGRFEANGTLDSGYGDSGFAQWIYEGFGIEQVQSFAFQSDGKVVVNCTVMSGQERRCAAFSRVGVDGWIDKDFGENGHTVLNIVLSPPTERSSPPKPSAEPDNNSLHSSGQSAANGRVSILPDGKILTSLNYFFNFSQIQGVLIRLHENGSLDTSFNQIGYLPVIHPDYMLNATVLRHVTVQPDGKYLGCGNVYDDSATPSSAMFVRYDPFGVLDEQFGEHGFVTIGSATHAHMIKATVMQPNQRILGFGDTHDNASVMTSLEPDGSPNIQFNRGQPLYTELQPDAITTWSGAAVQANGRIVLVGGLGERGQADIVVARFIDADLDPEFNDGQGWVRTRLENGVQSAYGMTLQDEKILVCAKLPGGKSALLRYLT
ncbi:MAG TPA: hypothetical protein VNV36_09345 [Pseudomonas sp.]|uniref:hypothetical protein n=1 Tax=Pseudomonas sp. TaxID=306 RepID=UPI002BE6FAB1|nr:hypothetical protein [Pseudomonas sp.]HWH86965.1 hypothetical protein [Pseudomonas sp.]